jgi:glutathione S-transferase
METTPPRLRLYWYEYSPYCIPIELVLRHSGIVYDVVTLEPGDPRPIISLTKGQYYQAPVVEDLFNHEVVFDRSPEGDDIPRYINSLAPLMDLFPDSVQGLHRILLHYIEHDCEAAGFKICDALSDNWLKTDVARGLFRRHKERKFGLGCIEEWRRDIDRLTETFHRVLAPFEHLLGKTPFLTGDRPVFADYALCGVVGNFLYPGGTSLPGNYLMLESWYTRMRGGNFRTAMDDLKVGEGGGASADAELQADVSDLDKALAELKLRPNSNALDVATGAGHTAIFLAEKGFHVTACDLSVPKLQQVATIAAERKLDITLHEHGPEALPYADSSFTLVTCRMAAHRFAAPESFVRETSRVLNMAIC